MNKENASKLWKIIQEAGDYLMGQRFTLTDLYRPWYTYIDLGIPSKINKGKKLQILYPHMRK